VTVFVDDPNDNGDFCEFRCAPHARTLGARGTEEKKPKFLPTQLPHASRKTPETSTRFRSA
jgi:hypothetical protein